MKNKIYKITVSSDAPQIKLRHAVEYSHLLLDLRGQPLDEAEEYLAQPINEKGDRFICGWVLRPSLDYQFCAVLHGGFAIAHDAWGAVPRGGKAAFQSLMFGVDQHFIFTEQGYFSIVNIGRVVDGIDLQGLFEEENPEYLPFRLKGESPTDLFCLEFNAGYHICSDHGRRHEFKYNYDKLGLKGLIFTEVSKTGST